MSSRPLPLADETSAPFWDGLKNQQLLVQQCSACGLRNYPPEVACPKCQSEALEFKPVSGKGTLYSYTTINRVLAAGMEQELPYTIALIELDEQKGLRMLADIVGAAPEALKVDMPMEVVFETHGDAVLAQFKPC